MWKYFIPAIVMVGQGILLFTQKILEENVILEEAAERRKESYVQPPGDSCPICQDIVDDTDIQYLSCGHALHVDCWVQLLKNYKYCPICRKRFRIYF